MTAEAMPGSRLRRPRTWVVGVTAVVLVAGVTTVAVATNSDKEHDAPATQASTALVQRQDLVNRELVSGTLAYKPIGMQLITARTGMITWLPAPGSVVRRGQALFGIDGTPVPLLIGSTPLWRDLDVGTTGPDVRALNSNLVALGYATRAALGTTDKFTAATAAGVKRLQHRTGLKESGTVRLGDVLFLPTAARIGAVPVFVGSSVGPGTKIADITSTTRVVAVDLGIDRRQLVHLGDAVEVTPPTGKALDGTVTAISNVPKSGEATGGGSPSPTVTVTIRLDHPAAARTLGEAPVQVAITTDSVKDALTVPVTALLALAEGGYGVEKVGTDGSRQLVVVKTGMYNDGDNNVQITAGDLHVGEKVVVAGV